MTFEQPVGQGIVRRGALVSQSPAMIRQWVDGMMQPTGGAREVAGDAVSDEVACTRGGRAVDEPSLIDLDRRGIWYDSVSEEPGQ